MSSFCFLGLAMSPVVTYVGGGHFGQGQEVVRDSEQSDEPTLEGN